MASICLDLRMPIATRDNDEQDDLLQSQTRWNQFNLLITCSLLN